MDKAASLRVQKHLAHLKQASSTNGLLRPGKTSASAQALPQRFEGKYALVTGGSKGIGAAVAVRLAREGAHVCVVYGRDKAGAERTVSEIVAHGIPRSRTLVLGADMAKPEQITAMFDDYFAHWPRLDVCIPNAGRWCRGSLVSESIEGEVISRAPSLTLKLVLMVQGFNMARSRIWRRWRNSTR